MKKLLTKQIFVCKVRIKTNTILFKIQNTWKNINETKNFFIIEAKLGLEDPLLDLTL